LEGFRSDFGRPSVSLPQFDRIGLAAIPKPLDFPSQR
jgi:hypothetical protein